MTFKIRSLPRLCLMLLLFCIVVRLLSLGAYPLMDTTEARYGEMARIMVETDNWVTPMFDYDTPFWGKPPMFAWLSATGMKVLGGHEFAVRVPHFLLGLCTLFLVYGLYRSQTKSYQSALLATMILASSSAFLVLTGAIMTDTALLFSITLSMLSFWQLCKHEEYSRSGASWSHLFFIGLALGMLAKGPIAPVLVAISLGLWVLLEGNIREVFGRVRWRSGILLFLFLTLPWYLIAELSTPGFLEYFLVGEHFKRFIVSGWEGDLYGSAHDRPRGLIWAFWIQATLPWAPLFLFQLWRIFKAPKQPSKTDSESAGNKIEGVWNSYLWCWMLAPMILFTFSGNILWSYVLPSLPPFAMLLASMQSTKPLNPKIYSLGLVMPILIIAAVIAIHLGALKNSEHDLVRNWQEQTLEQDTPLVYVGKRPFSARYYSLGKAQYSGEKLANIVAEGQPIYVAIKHNQLGEDWQTRLPSCYLVDTFSERSLLLCNSAL